MQQFDYVEVKTNHSPDSSIIWLHGLGADGHDFEKIVEELRLPEKLKIRFIFPHAPIQPVTLNAGYPMRAWFDIFGLDEKSSQDEPGIRKSQLAIEQLIESIVNTGIASDRIILGGFSQGGALALHIALRYPKKLAGAIGLSTYLPLSDLLATERHNVNSNLSIFLGHGTQDNVVPLRFGQVSYQLLKDLHYAVTWNQYDMAHSVNTVEVQDLSRWIQSVLHQDE